MTCPAELLRWRVLANALLEELQLMGLEIDSYADSDGVISDLWT